MLECSYFGRKRHERKRHFAKTSIFVGLSGSWITSPKWGGSHSWLLTLGALKGAGARGLLVRIGVPQIGIAAAIGLVLFFVGPITVVIRARWYSHLPWPGDVSLAGCSIAGITVDGVVSERWIGFS